MTLNRPTAMKLAVVILLTGAAVGLYLSPVRDQLTVETIRRVARELGNPWYGPPLFVLAYAVGAVLFVPATIFILASGLIWGWKLGGIYSLAGAGLGAVASCAIARFVGAGLLSRAGQRADLVVARLQRAGFKTLLMLRLVPVFPFAILNYGAGLAGIRYRDFIPATLLGITPATFVVAYSADALVSGAMTKGEALERLVIVLLLAGLALGVPMLIKRRWGAMLGR